MRKYVVGLISNWGINNFVDIVVVTAKTRKQAINAAIDKKFGEYLSRQFDTQVLFIEVATAKVEAAFVQHFQDALQDYQNAIEAQEHAPIGDEYHRLQRQTAYDRMYKIHDLGIAIFPNADFNT